MQYIRYSIYPKNSEQNVKEIRIISSDNVYRIFAEILKDDCDSEAQAIFYGDQFLKRNSTFQQHDNLLNYEVYQISKMKKNLDCQIDSQKKHLFKAVQQQKVQVVQPEFLNQNEPSQLLIQLSDLIEKKEKELQELKIRGQSIINPNKSALIFFSDVKVMNSRCALCLQEIEEEKLQTLCYHDYHPLCFQFIVEAQIATQTFIQCICNKRLSLKVLNQLCNPADINYLLTKVYQNQLVQIQKNTKFKQLKLVKCSGKNCQCLYMINNNNILNNCPYCKI